MNFSAFRNALLFSFLGCLLTASAAFAQPPLQVRSFCGALRQMPSGPPVMIGVEPGSADCNFRERITPVDPTEMETLNIQVEGFQPGDHLTHVYGVTFFSDSSIGNGSFFPDETGYAQVELPRRANDRQLIISSMHVDTKELRLSMDLTDVSLESLVNALYNVKRNRELNVGILNGVRPGAPPIGAQAAMHNSLVADGRRLSLQAIDRTLDETLDLIYQQSGCSVFEQQGTLLIQQCR